MEIGQRAEIIVQRKFVECQSLYQDPTGAIRKTNEIEITLKDTILTRSAMDGDVGKVERATLAFKGVGEVVEIHRNLLVFYEYLHGIATLFYDVAIIFFGIHE